MKKKLISVVVPIFNEESNIVQLLQKLKVNIPSKYEYELILVDDGSTDRSLSVIEKLAVKNSKIKYLSFSRNFGHQIALKAGIDYSRGDCVITIDADLQHPPEYVPALIKQWEKGFEVVNSKRLHGPNISPLKSLSSKLFYKLINSISDVNILEGGADFRLLDKKVVEVMRRLNESAIFLRGLVPWSGFKATRIKYKVGRRFSGKTKYSVKKMILFALDGVTSFSIRPLRIATFVGFFLAFASGVYGVYAIIVRVVYQIGIPGWASIVISVAFMGGIQLMMLGIIGEYLGKLFIESKKRPLYIVKKSNIKND